ncbi:MAG TPA: hypothetical protein VHW01_09815 [Polyangiaceae bacterium]|nr:hypothetical protein [Polyangiaceae bacterium]
MSIPQSLVSSACRPRRAVISAVLGVALCQSASAESAQGAPPNKPASYTYVARKPTPETQVQKTAAERGVNPCDTPDPGFGVYGKWEGGIGMGQLIMPKHGGITHGGDFDVMVHFHGHEAVRKEWVQVMDGAVLVGIDLGIGSGSYETAFQAPDVFPRLIESVERAVAKKNGRKDAHARHIGLSAWSAGYGAVQWILGQDYAKKNVDTVILLDGLHCGYMGPAINGAPIAMFTEFAKRAADGETLMFVSHSSIIPPGYASTTETADYLVHAVGGVTRDTHGSGPLGMDLISRYSKGNFHVRGFSGNDKMDHCAQIGEFRDVLKVHVRPRWNSPRGRGD